MGGEACRELFNITAGSLTYKWSQGDILPFEPKFHLFPFVPLAVNLHSLKGNWANLGYTGFGDPEEEKIMFGRLMGLMKVLGRQEPMFYLPLPRRVP